MSTHRIRCGPLSGFLMDGQLRKIEYAGSRIVQKLYFAVRDRDWLNVPCVITDPTQSETGHSGSCSYRISFDDGQIKMDADIRITVSDNEIVATAHGVAKSTFLKNRIGFCLDLPVSLSGARCEVGDPEGVVTKGEFPVHVSPHQPFLNISTMKWRSRGIGVEISFEGDVFEMEDQRNWTDASYKVYSTPLDRPFPVQVREGDLFYQRIAIKIDGGVAEREEIERDPEKPYRLPELGICHSPQVHRSIMSIAEGGSPFGYYRADIRFEPGWKEKVLSVLNAATESGMDICFYTFFGADHRAGARELSLMLRVCIADHGRIRFCLLSQREYVLDDKAFAEIAGTIKAVSKNIRIGTGTDANFAQLNRSRPSGSHADFISYAIHPQEHAHDPMSMVENIYGQYDTVRTAESFRAGTPVHIGALSLFRRFNANNRIEQGNDDIPRYDLAGSPFEASWFAGSLARLAQAGVDSVVCCCELNEDSGLLKLFGFMGGHPADGLLSTRGTEREGHSVLLWRSGGKQCGVAANHTPTEKQIEVLGHMIALNPYAVEFIGI